MTSSEHHRTSSVSTMAFIGRSVLSLRRNQVASMEQYHEEELQDLELFQSHVTNRLLSIVPKDQEFTVLSFPFLHKLLDAFLSCKEEFKNMLLRNPGLVAKPPNDRHVSDLLDRSVKSLDICNFLIHTIRSVRVWSRHAGIAATAVPNGQLMRAKKALANLLATFESVQGQESGKKTERTWSLRYKNGILRSGHRTWSVSKQVQCMTAGLSLPGSGLAVAVYTMSSVLAFTMWALVAAFPCTSFLAAPVGPPRQLAWSVSMIGLQERIGEEWRRRGKREGGLVEYVEVERCGKEMMESIVTERGTEIVTKATELAVASRRLEEGLGLFEREVRKVFHAVVRNRAEVVKFLDQNSKCAPPFIVLEKM